MNETDDTHARKGILKQLVRAGGSLPIKDLHEFSSLRFGRGHQAFSQTMEGLVGAGLVGWDGERFAITDAGRKSCGPLLV